MSDHIVEAWRTHLRLSLAYLEGVPPQTLLAKAPSMGRSIGQIIAHMHNNRLDWLNPLAPDLAAGLKKIDRKQHSDKSQLMRSLKDSGDAIERLLQRSVEGEGKVRGFAGSVVSFLGYLVAHDAYHHAEVGMSVTQLGYPMERDASHALWDWRKLKGEDSA